MIDYDRLFSRAASAMQESAIRKMGALGLRVPDLISFAAGFPAPDLFAWEEFRDIAREALDSRDPSALQYGATRGYRPLLEALPEILDERGIRASVDELIVTTGSQQALDLTARIFVDPGDVVLLELPTYTGAITAFRNAQARLVGVAQDAGGIDLGDLARVAARERAAGRRIAFLYVVPNFQNPTGLLVDIDRRRAVLEWARRENLVVVEDDPYGALHFDLDGRTGRDPDTRPLKADDEGGRVVYMSSFSKTLAPGFRVAWIAAPPAVTAKLEVAKQAADLCTGPLDQRIVFEAWRRGTLNARLPTLRRAYREKRDVMEAALRRELGDAARWVQPRGGFFLWTEFPEGLDTESLLARALAHKVVYVAGSAFFVDGRTSTLARLSFAGASAPRIEEGVGRLAAAVREALDLRASAPASKP
jgi:2-aminoadipate transaminase